MTSRSTNAGARTLSAPDTEKLLEQYGCGPIQFTGTADALYERHLLFDNVVDPAAAGPRERYEAVARSLRPAAVRRARPTPDLCAPRGAREPAAKCLE